MMRQSTAIIEQEGARGNSSLVGGVSRPTNRQRRAQQFLDSANSLAHEELLTLAGFPPLEVTR
jgi:hypothetical protein